MELLYPQEFIVGLCPKKDPWFLDLILCIPVMLATSPHPLSLGVPTKKWG